jgi:NAD(P)H-hydrate epimerase
VTLASRQVVIDKVATRLLETTMLVLPAETTAALAQLKDVAKRYDALLVGPGLARLDDGTADLVMQVLSGALEGPHAAVVDADGLYALSAVPQWWTRVSLPLVLTPHAGEMARLTGRDVAAIEADRLSVASTFARQWGHVVVLKGAPTVIAAPDGQVAVNPTGNPLLATAGSGDVLTGVIAAFLAGRTPPFDAARAGVYIHGLAADLAVARFGDRGMVASDLFESLPAAMKQVLA